MHFKYKASVVFQIVFGEFQIRAKGEVNKAQKMKKRLSEQIFGIANFDKMVFNELNFLVTAHERVTSFNRAVQVAIAHSQTNSERDVNLHTLAPVDGCCSQAKTFYNKRPIFCSSVLIYVIGKKKKKKEQNSQQLSQDVQNERLFSFCYQACEKRRVSRSIRHVYGRK